MDQMEYPHKDNTSHSSDKNLRNPACGLDAYKTGEESSDHASKQTYDKITQQTVTCTANEHSCQPACNDSADNPD
jgi:hypothetical protein